MGQAIPDEQFVKVRDPAELKAGLTCMIKPCCLCPKVHVMVLINTAEGRRNDGFERFIVNCWIISPKIHGTEYLDYQWAIDMGHLWRLKDLDYRDETRREMSCDLDDAKRKTDKMPAYEPSLEVKA